MNLLYYYKKIMHCYNEDKNLFKVGQLLKQALIEDYDYVKKVTPNHQRNCYIGYENLPNRAKAGSHVTFDYKDKDFRLTYNNATSVAIIGIRVRGIKRKNRKTGQKFRIYRPHLKFIVNDPHVAAAILSYIYRTMLKYNYEKFFKTNHTV